MSDKSDNKGPLSPEEMTQIEHGISGTIRQPVLAPRHLKVLLNRLNDALGTIQELEKRVASLESKSPAKPESKPQTPTKPKSPDDI
jgi:hypothetical protein